MKKGNILPLVLILAIVAFTIGTLFLINKNKLTGFPTSTSSSQSQTTKTLITDETTTSNWETYINSKNGFTMQYPPGPTQKTELEDGLSLIYSPPFQPGQETMESDNPDMVFDASRHTSVQEAKQYIINFYGSAKASHTFTSKNINIGKIISAEQIVLHFTDMKETNIFTIIALPNKKVLVVTTGWKDKNGEKHEKIADQILSTFKFTN